METTRNRAVTGQPGRSGRSVPVVACLLGALLLAGCATPGPVTGPPPTTGSGGTVTVPPPTTAPATTAPAAGFAVTGTVAAAPGCPGPQRSDSPCPARPVPGARVELTAGHTTVTTTTDADGRFSVTVPGGVYRIVAYNTGGRSQTSRDITVRGPVNVTLVVDSGMR